MAGHLRHNPLVIRTRLSALSLALSLALLLPLSGCALVDVALGGYRATMPGESMEPTIRMGSLLTASQPGDYAPRTGDIIIYRTPEGWAGTVAGQRRVGRVIGVPGSTVKCCVTGGLLELNGKPLEEPYVTIRPSSRVEFDIRVPQGRLWIMNDHRHVSKDSRYYMDAPGGGTIGVTDVEGVVTKIDPPAQQ
ncbi:signal peptidase I [Nonomuraea salmonea]|uniref:signal peptidase I n=1 Tax=Nonomuraea salmonea TaxID=46181 RepID=UPI002FE6FD7C